MTRTTKLTAIIMAMVMVLSVTVLAATNHTIGYGQLFSGNESNTVFAGITPIYKYNTGNPGNEEGLFVGNFSVVDVNSGDSVALTYLSKVSNQDGKEYIIDTVYVKAGNGYKVATISPALKVGDTVVFTKEALGIMNTNGSASQQISHIGIYPGPVYTDEQIIVRRSFFLAAHASTYRVVNGRVQSETLWAADGAPGSNRFTQRGSWASYIKFDENGIGVEQGVEKVYNLYAGQHILVGTLSVSFDENFIYVKYTTVNGWMLNEAHLDIAEQFSGLRGTNGLGRYPYKATFGQDTTEYIFIIELPSQEYGIVK